MKKAIQDSLDLIDFRFGEKTEKVAIKPNMCYYWDYSTGMTTDPKFVAAVVGIIRERLSQDVQISIVESDASAMKCRYAFKILGYEKMVKEKNVSLVNLTLDRKENVEVKVDNRSYGFEIPDTIRNSDLLLNIPKIKYMTGVKISCALKNIFGCNPYPKKFRYHPDLDRVIVALNKVMKSDLCIVDGIVVSGQYPTKLGLIMASKDPVAIDSMAAEIAGINPKHVRHVMLAQMEGIGKMACKNVGENLEYFTERFPRKNAKQEARETILSFGAAMLEKLHLIFSVI